MQRARYFWCCTAAVMTFCVGMACYAHEIIRDDEQALWLQKELIPLFLQCPEQCDNLPEDAICDCPGDRFFDCPEDAECRLQLGIEGSSVETTEEDFHFMLSNILYPASAHQLIELIMGPFTVPLADGRGYLVPPGFYVRLEDGSIWRMKNGDMSEIQEWLNSDPLYLKANRSWFSSSFKYYLYNVNTHTQVCVSPEIGPKLSSPLRRYLYDRNLIVAEVLLNDGSLWEVSSLDSHQIQDWHLEDSVIIGVNDDWLSYKRPNLLINLGSDEWVRARWIH